MGIDAQIEDIPAKKLRFGHICCWKEKSDSKIFWLRIESRMTKRKMSIWLGKRVAQRRKCCHVYKERATTGNVIKNPQLFWLLSYNCNTNVFAEKVLSLLVKVS